MMEIKFGIAKSVCIFFAFFLFSDSACHSYHPVPRSADRGTMGGAQYASGIQVGLFLMLNSVHSDRFKHIVQFLIPLGLGGIGNEMLHLFERDAFAIE